MTVGTRIQKNRTPLQDVIPLETPYVLFVDPSDRCNFQCRFCPTGDRALMRTTPGRMAPPMSMELYTRIIDSACTFSQQLKTLRLYKDGEPLMNRFFPEMVRYARSRGVARDIDTTTNGALLRPEVTDRIIEAGITRINISIEGTSDAEYQSFSQAPGVFDTIVRNVQYLYEHRGTCHVFAKINADTVDETSVQRFRDVFEPICNEIGIERVMTCWNGFEESTGSIVSNDTLSIYGDQINEVMVCPYVFYSMVVNSDGTVSACFLDWNRQLIAGTIEDASLPQIWQGPVLTHMRRQFLAGRRKDHPICGVCEQLSHGSPDNIDVYAPVLLERMRDIQCTK